MKCISRFWGSNSIKNEMIHFSEHIAERAISALTLNDSSIENQKGTIAMP